MAAGHYYRQQIPKLYARGRPQGRWYTQCTRSTVGRVSHPIAVPVYMGIIYRGAATLSFATVSHKQTCSYAEAHEDKQTGFAAEPHDMLEQ